MLLRSSSGSEPIHTRNARRDTQNLARRRRLSWCEVYSPPKRQGGIVREEAKMRPLGKVRLGITQSTKTAEITPDNNTASSVIEYELAGPLNWRVEPSSRVFEPAKYPAWKANQLYGNGQLVVATNWDNGKTIVFRCIKSGMSGTTEPVWPTRMSARIWDGQTGWVATFVATIYEVIAINKNETQAIETIVRAKEINS